MIEVRECLPDGTEIKAVRAHLARSGVAKLVTIHFFDRGVRLRIEGERIKRLRWVHADRYMVAVAAEAVDPPDDPSEPCFEAEVVQSLREVEDRARSGDVDRLKRRGKVDEAVDVA